MIRLLAIFLTTGLSAAAPDEPGIGSERGLRLHRDYDAESFAKLEPAQQPINFSDIDHALLSAAIFHETNERRAKNNLPALSYLPELREAARIQALGMKKQQAIAHVHPDKALRTLGDRLDEVGLEPMFRAENVAMVFGIRYESGEPFYLREEDGEKILSDTPEGPPIPRHSYLSFAESLVADWMNSPGHRKNILAKPAESLGAAGVRSEAENGPDRFYCAQVFFAPIPEGVRIVEP